jgi:disulfide bond formation protein DsbB
MRRRAFYDSGMNYRSYIRSNPARSLVLAAALASLIILSAALVSQYGFGLFPCELCIFQRIPYAMIAALGLASAWLIRTERALATVALLCVMLFAADAAIAVYHTGVELKIFPGPSGCTADNSREQTLEEMRRAIMEAQLVPCDQAMAYFMGLSMAAWNALAATVLAVGTGVLLRRIRRRQKGLVP